VSPVAWGDVHRRIYEIGASLPARNQPDLSQQGIDWMKLGLLFVLIAALFGVFSLSFTPWTLPLLWPCLRLV
jgi:hypothetical protein